MFQQLPQRTRQFSGVWRKAKQTVKTQLNKKGRGVSTLWLLVSAAIAFLVFNKVSSWSFSLPSFSVNWNWESAAWHLLILLIVVGIGYKIYQLITGKKYSTIWKWAVIGLLVFIFGGKAIDAIRSMDSAPKETSKALSTRTITVTNQDWQEAEWHRILPGQKVVWERGSNVTYLVRTRRPGGGNGKIYVFPADPENDTRSACERNGWVPEATEALQFRTLEKGELTMELVSYPYGAGSPCATSTKPPKIWKGPKVHPIF
jgi:hypothetical protein